MMKETKHDYQNCLVGNYFSNDMSGKWDSWEEFKKNHWGFNKEDTFDDTYHFVFRYDIHKRDNGYQLELCIMLQRKGIYTHIEIDNITQELLDSEITEWLRERKKYIDKLWE